MTQTWVYARQPQSKPLTTTQKGLLAAVTASPTRVFDARAWNVRTITGLWLAGLIYTCCDGRYKSIALIHPPCQDAEVQAPAPSISSVRAAHVVALEAAVADGMTLTPAAIALHNEAYARLRMVLRTVETGCCEMCGEEHPAIDLKPLTHADVGDWFEATQGWSRDVPQCPYCRERWHQAAGYDFDWQAEG